MSKTILLTPEQEQTLKSISETIATTGPFEIWHIPYAFKSLGEGSYERFELDELPKKIKDHFNETV